jgi:hypothetical protein
MSEVLVCGAQEHGLFLVLLLPVKQVLEAEGCVALKVLY